MTDNHVYYEDEISIKELLLIIIKGRKTIALVTAVCIFAATVVSVYMIESTYEANTILLVSNASSKPATVDGGGSGVEGLMNTLSANIPQTITTYKEQMLTTDMMRRVIVKLALGETYSTNGLKSMIMVSNINETNLLNVIVTANDPVLARDIANALAEEYTTFVAEMNTQRLSKSSEFLNLKVEEEKEKLDRALEKYKVFLAQSPGTSEIQSEISSKSERLSSLKSEKDALLINYERSNLNLENKITLQHTELDMIEALLKKSTQFIVQKQTVLENSTALVILQSAGVDPSETLKLVIENEEINENFMQLQIMYNQSLISVEALQQEKENLKKSFEFTNALIVKEIQMLTSELELLKVDYAEKSNDEKLIQKEVSRAESSYDQFVKSYEENRVAESADIGKSTILINSKAVINENPVGPRKFLNIAIAAILGLIASVFYVFFKHYWNEAA